MTPETFFRDLSAIENFLYNLDPDCDKEQSFLLLLDHLKSKDMVTTDLVSELLIIWETRNKLANPGPGLQEVPKDIFIKLSQIKQALGL